MLKSLFRYRPAGVLARRSGFTDLHEIIERDLAIDRRAASANHWMRAAAATMRAELAEAWARTQKQDRERSARRAYYLSAEFLIGRTTANALSALGLSHAFETAMHQRGIEPADVIESERDAALGNGGLGRLAACFLDSLATLGVPSFGYGIRYEFGMFRQSIEAGRQREHPDDWLFHGNPWEIPRPDVAYTVGYGGTTASAEGRHVWHPAETVTAAAYDMIIPGHGTERVSTLRLWSARLPRAIDLGAHAGGDYAGAALPLTRAQNLSWVLYPDDSTPQGRELRLRQEYFFVAASVQDIVKRHVDEGGTAENLGTRVAIQLNDTHPAMAVPELMRLLIDEHGLSWEAAWTQVGRIVSYTNHTLMPEALEVWPLSLMRAVLPRHAEIVEEINRRFLASLPAEASADAGFAGRVAIVSHDAEPLVRMAFLSIVASHRVNGVAKLHSELCVQTIFADFARLYPERFINVTNGVTPRRWLAQCNPALATEIDAKIGRSWRSNLDQLAHLADDADDEALRRGFARIKLDNKRRLALLIARETGIEVDPQALFDVQIKRIHEYKRQLLNVLHVVHRYRAMLADPERRWQPRVHIFAGKAASAYHTAKQIIRLIHDVADRINADARLQGRLKVVFLPDYRVSLAEAIFPGADVSEQISTAGTEASGTGNMKFALNGALTVGTWDGANIEIAERVGRDNIFVFGKRANEIETLRREGYAPRSWMERDGELSDILASIGNGEFSPEEPERYAGLVASLVGEDRYFLLADFADYARAHRDIDAAYADQSSWHGMAIRNVAAMGYFSSDRTIGEYCRHIWNITPEHSAYR